MISASVICDSINPDGKRLTTIVGTCHRFVLAELNTHRVFSRNSASSRAIPTTKRIEQVLEHPAIPIEFGANQAGMQAGEALSGDDARVALLTWLGARDAAVSYARELADLGVHKQVVNRLLEPFMWHTVVITSSYWDNFFDQRRSLLAQPEIRAFAEEIRLAMGASTPRPLLWGEWHLPFAQDLNEMVARPARVRISAARCARTSYETHEGEINITKDLELYDKLVRARPMHASPLEHPAMAWRERLPTGNFHRTWVQHRYMVEEREDLVTVR